MNEVVVTLIGNTVTYALVEYGNLHYIIELSNLTHINDNFYSCFEGLLSNSTVFVEAN